jgi:iron complex transport system substrate-binding protein
MKRTIPILTALLLTLAACGGDDDAEATVPDTTVAETTVPETTVAETTLPATTLPATTVPETTPPATTEPSGSSDSNSSDSAAVALDADQQAAADAWSTVFDSAVPFADKAALVEDADALQATIEGYTTLGETMGGVTLVPTAVTVEGDTATITYDVMFGGTAAYEDVEGAINRVDGVWIVPRSEFCGFMAQARNACPA